MNVALQFFLVIAATGIVFTVLGLIEKVFERRQKRKNPPPKPTRDCRNWQREFSAWWGLR